MLKRWGDVSCLSLKTTVAAREERSPLVARSAGSGFELMHVRPATPGDAAAIHHVSVASCRAAYTEALADPEPFLTRVRDPLREENLREKLARTADDDRVVYLVGVDDGIVGFVQVLVGERTPEAISANTAYLKSLYVHPDHWRRGIGSDLLEAALARLPDNIERVRLDVLAANEAGRRFYEAQGFEPVGRGSFEAGGRSYETVVYARPGR